MCILAVTFVGGFMFSSHTAFSIIIYGLNSCDVELTGNLLELWQGKRLVIWSANAVADEQIGKGLGWVPDNAELGDRDPPYPETDSCCMKGAENLGKYTLPVLDRGLSFPWQAEEFCEEDKHCPSHSSLSAVSSSWHDKIPKQGYWECIIQKCSVVWVEKRGNIRCCFSNKDPVSCLTPQR